MYEEKLLASVVVFRELYDNDKDIYDVIAEFIKSVIQFEKKWSFNVTEISQFMKQHFDFNIPDAVIKTTLKKRLKRDSLVSIDRSGLYIVNSSLMTSSSELINDFEQTKGIYSKIIDELFEYITSKIGSVITDAEKRQIADDLNDYLLSIGSTGKSSTFISSFIIENQEKPNFKDNLNAIKEGLVLYNGVRYSSDLNEIGAWNSDLTIYLDTEHLYNACGYNGELYKETFDDFYKLISEVNRNTSTRGGRKKIYLKYFKESKDEVDGFFYVAECIIDGKTYLDPSKTAMQYILNGCKSKSEIITKKAKFYTELNSLGIEQEEHRNYYSDIKYNLDDQNTLESLEQSCIGTEHRFNKDGCIHYLKLFTRINALRKGVNKIGFEKIGYIIMSGNGIAHFVAHHFHIKGEHETPFATNIDFITNRLWFKLSKGLGSNFSKPKSFDVITKAKLILSSQVKNTVANKFSILTEEFNQGKISKEQATAINAELRLKSVKPEDITPENITETLKFIEESSIEKHLRERSLLLDKVKKGDAAIQELNRRNLVELRSKKLHAKKKIRASYIIAAGLYCLGIFLLFAIGIVFLTWIRSGTDSVLSILSAILTFVLGVIPLVRIKPFFKWLRKRAIKTYKAKIKNLMIDMKNGTMLN